MPGLMDRVAELERQVADLREVLAAARQVVAPPSDGFQSASPLPPHLRMTEARAQLIARIDAALQ